MVTLDPDPAHIALIAPTRPSEAIAEFLAWFHSPAAFAAQVRAEDTRAEALLHEERRAVHLDLPADADVFPGPV